MKCAVVTTTSPDIASALDGLIERLSDSLEGTRPDLLVVYFTPHHVADAALIRERMGVPAFNALTQEAELGECIRELLAATGAPA